MDLQGPSAPLPFHGFKTAAGGWTWLLVLLLTLSACTPNAAQPPSIPESTSNEQPPTTPHRPTDLLYKTAWALTASIDPVREGEIADALRTSGTWMLLPFEPPADQPLAISAELWIIEYIPDGAITVEVFVNDRAHDWLLTLSQPKPTMPKCDDPTGGWKPVQVRGSDGCLLEAEAENAIDFIVWTENQVTFQAETGVCLGTTEAIAWLENWERVPGTTR